MIFPTCIEVARKFPGSMAGAQNTTNQLGSFLSGVLFGYVARISGSYDRPVDSDGLGAQLRRSNVAKD
jgi:hypothetical protein